MARRWSWAAEDRVAALVQRCADARQLNQVHARVIAGGQSQNNFLIAKLVRASTELGSLDQARSIAASVDIPNAFVWTALIRGYSSQSGASNREAILSYRRMHQCRGFRPLTFTLSSVLKACTQVPALHEGVQIHSHAFKHGFRNDARVQTTLVNLYSICGRVAEARKVFDGITISGGGGGTDVQAWNTMIGGYAADGDMENAQYLFDSMPKRNSFTLVEMISGYASAGRMGRARWLLDTASPSDKNEVVYTSMITGYAKSGDLPSARLVFDEMTKRDVASWNAMISGYANADLNSDALDLFRQMLSSKCKAVPNQATVATVVSVCSRSGSPRLARWIQDYVDSQGSQLLNSHIVAALIDLHSKCGDLNRSCSLFSGWKHKDLICYSTMIAGFAIHGQAKDAIKVFDEIQAVGLNPDAICFISTLTACSHAGMVEEGRRYFAEMSEKYRIAPTADHYTCIVDLLGRAGHIGEAYRLVQEDMARHCVQPHAGVWGALLSACRVYGNVDVGEEAARQLVELEPENAGNFVLLSNIYSRAGRWEGVARVRAEMRRRGMRKPPGCSWVEVEDGRVRTFLNGEVYDVELEMVMEVLNWALQEEGYLPAIWEFE